MKHWLLFIGFIGLSWASLDAPSVSVPNDQPIPPGAAGQDDSKHSTVKADTAIETTTIASNSSSTSTTVSSNTTGSTTPGVHPVLPSNYVDPSQQLLSTDASMHRDQPGGQGGPSQPTEVSGTMGGTSGTNEESSSPSTQGVGLSSMLLSVFSVLLACAF